MSCMPLRLQQRLGPACKSKDGHETPSKRSPSRSIWRRHLSPTGHLAEAKYQKALSKTWGFPSSFEQMPLAVRTLSRSHTTRPCLASHAYKIGWDQVLEASSEFLALRTLRGCPPLDHNDASGQKSCQCKNEAVIGWEDRRIVLATLAVLSR